MLVHDLITIGNRLLEIRKKAGLTQAEAAEAAGISDRTYADIERGNVNMRVETLLKICEALNITPNDIFIDNSEELLALQKDLNNMIKAFNAIEQYISQQKDKPQNLLEAYLNSIK